jgi:hypothetical protein
MAQGLGEKSITQLSQLGGTISRRRMWLSLEDVIGIVAFMLHTGVKATIAGYGHYYIVISR